MVKISDCKQMNEKIIYMDGKFIWNFQQLKFLNFKEYLHSFEFMGVIINSRNNNHEEMKTRITVAN